MNFSQHLIYFKEKAFAIMGPLKLVLRKPSSFSVADKLRIYWSVVIPGLAYGCNTWYRGIKSLKKNIRKIQRPFLLMITGSYRSTSSMKLYKFLGILPLDFELERIIEKENLKKVNKLNKESIDTLNLKYDPIKTAEVSFELNLVRSHGIDR